MLVERIGSPCPHRRQAENVLDIGGCGVLYRQAVGANARAHRREVGVGDAELAESVTSTLPDGRLVLIAESFSGPLALAITL